MNTIHTICIVDDDEEIRSLLSDYLRRNGFSTCTAGNAAEFLEIQRRVPCSLIVMDIMLPGMNGLELFRTLRAESTVPVIFLTALGDITDRIVGLELGADDYLSKPFEPRELLARIRVALRHMYKQGGGKTQTLFQVGELQLDAEKRRVFLRGAEIHVTPMEYSLLTLLFKNQGKVLTTAVIIREIWGPGYGNDTQALRALMAGLRRKLEKNPAKPRYILTEIGVGYRLADE